MYWSDILQYNVLDLESEKNRNILLKISYDGSRYHGWQIQKNAVSVQEVFQNSLRNVIDEDIELKGCSRTDSGVHANMYCINFKTNSFIPCERLVMALNRFLPADIAVLSADEVPMDFHARYSCIGKEYIYKIWNNKVRNPFLNNYSLHYWYDIDIDLLNYVGSKLIGEHNFTSFCTVDNRVLTDAVRNVSELKFSKQGDVITMMIRADGFLYNMVRIIVGTMLRVAQGKIKPDDISYIIEAKSRKAAGPTAPAKGLYLNRVFY